MPDNMNKVRCKTDLRNHNFQTIGEYDGKTVDRCADCQLTIVDFPSLYEENILATITLAKDKQGRVLAGRLNYGEWTEIK